MSYAEWGNALYSGKRPYQIIRNRRIFLTTGLVLVLITIIGIVIFGVNPSIDFKGGTNFTVTNTQNNPPQQPAYDALKTAGITGNPKVFQMGINGLRVQTSQLATEEETQIQFELAKVYKVNVKNVSKGSVGPSRGASVSRRAAIGLVVFLAMVSLLLMAYSRTWTMAVPALFALIHDLMITIGAFALTQVEVTPATIIGLLTILGYSLYDTVVVFDKIRENTKDMMNQSRSTYDEPANLSVNQTMARPVNTSITAILPVSAILSLGSVLLGASTLHGISMSLFIGMIVGTFSSTFIATPLLTIIRNHSQLIKNHNAKVETARQKVLGQGSAILNPDGTVSTKPVVNTVPVQPGHHLGQIAQPKRKKKKN